MTVDKPSPRVISGHVGHTKPLNRVGYYVEAEIEPDGQAFINALYAERNPGSGKSMVLTHAEADGARVRTLIDYTVRGGCPSDVTRMLTRTGGRLGFKLGGFEGEQRRRERLEW